jgi:hypothetical protein
MNVRALVVMVVTGLFVEQALAQQPAKFDEAYNKGQDAYNLGKYEDACSR